VVIRNSRFTRNGRQGIALVAARNVVIEGNSISEVRRSTFDFEPLAAGAGVEDVVIRNNRIGAVRLLFVAAEGSGPVNDVTIERNRLTGQVLGVQMRDLSGGLRRNWRVLDNVSEVVSGNRSGAAMEFHRVDGLLVRGNRQPFDPRRNMLGIRAYGACNVVITANDFPGTLRQGDVEGTC
jgi:polygalacturonase